MEWLLIWPALGMIGFAMYCSNSNTRPKKLYLLFAALFTHLCFGLIALFYGYFCFSGRKLKVKEN